MSQNSNSGPGSLYYSIVPHQVIVQILGGYAFKPSDEGFQSEVISVDVLNVIDPKFSNTRLNLHKLDTVMPRKRLISHFFIRAEDSAF